MSASHTLPLDMLNAGAQLANIAFNLKQRVGHVISTHDAEVLDRCHRQWDATLASSAAVQASLSSQPPQIPPGMPDLTSPIVNDACWEFVEAMPHKIPGPIFNDLKPAIYAALERFQAALSSQAPAALHETDIYDFAGWLTTRPGVMPVGSTSEAGPMADAVGEYIKTYPERFAALQSRQPAAPVAAPSEIVTVCLNIQGGETHTTTGQWMSDDIGYLVCVPREWQPAPVAAGPDAFDLLKKVSETAVYVANGECALSFAVVQEIDAMLAATPTPPVQQVSAAKVAAEALRRASLLQTCINHKQFQSASALVDALTLWLSSLTAAQAEGGSK
jgi:hypothetical protein